MSSKSLTWALGLAVGCAAHGAWASPPSGALSKEFLAAAEVLRRHGMADPRGGELREVTAAGLDKVVGWVMPAPKGQAPQVVCWDGLSYSATTVGARVDLAEYVSRMLVLGYGYGAAARTPWHAVGVALLARLGETDLAEKIAAKVLVEPEKARRYLVYQFTSTMFERAVAEFYQRQYGLAAADAAALVAVRAELGPSDFADEGYGYDVVAVLAQDAKRRADGPAPSKPDFEALRRLTVPERVSRLIAAMDQLEGTGFGYRPQPILAELIGIGEPAIDALLDCAEHDQRLTRPAFPYVVLGTPIRVVRVSNVAQSAVMAILGIGELPRDVQGRIPLAEVRKYWSSMRNVPVVERWYRTLSDDQAAPRQWVESARLIARRADVRERGLWVGAPIRARGGPLPPLLGEGLRDGRSPSVSDLMATRAMAILSAVASRVRGQVVGHSEGVEIGLCLARWDPAGSRDALRKIDSAATAALIGQRSEDYNLRRMLAFLTIKRVTNGDPEARSSYLYLLDRLTEASRGLSMAALLSPLLRNSRATQALAMDLIGDPKSAWNPRTLAKSRRGWYALDLMMRSPLIESKPMRDAVADLLRDRTVVGRIWLEKAYGTRYQRDDGETGGRFYGPDLADKLTYSPPLEAPRPLRICDLVADSLLGSPGASLYRPYWLDEPRDRAIAQMLAFVRSGKAKAPSTPTSDRDWEEPLDD